MDSCGYPVYTILMTTDDNKDQVANITGATPLWNGFESQLIK